MKKINQYKNNELSEKELDEFTRELIRAKYRKEKKKKWTQVLEEKHDINREEQDSKKNRRKFSGRFLLMMAASLVFLLIAFFVIRSNSQPGAVQLAEAYLSKNKFPNSTATKGQTEILVLQSKMAEAYNRDNFTEVIHLGQQLIDQNEARVEDYFFMGLSYLYKDDAQNAITFLKKVQEQKKEEQQFKQESRWFLALAYIKAVDFENAKQELQGIVKEKSWNAKEAKQLLEALDEVEGR